MKHYYNILFLVVGLVLAWSFCRSSAYLYPIVFAILLLFFCILIAGIVDLRLNYFLPSVNRISGPEVLLTFDDGPDPNTTPRVLDALDAHGVKALFFVIGSKAKAHPEIVHQILDRGHWIGNHTYTHPYDFALSSAQQVRREIDQTNELIRGFIGTSKVFFRPPVGYTNPIIARVVRSMNMKVLGWSKRSFDTVLIDPVMLRKRLLRLTKPGNIVLLHDNLAQTAAMLPGYLTEAQKNGIIFADKECINRLQSCASS